MFSQKELKSADKIKEYLQLNNVKLEKNRFFTSTLNSHVVIDKKVTEIQKKLFDLHPDNIKAVFRTPTFVGSNLTIPEKTKLQKLEFKIQLFLSFMQDPDLAEETRATFAMKLDNFINEKDQLMLQKGKSYFTIIVDKVKGLDQLIFDIPSKDKESFKLKI